MWINTLAEVYKHTRVSEIAVQKLHQRFSGYDSETLSQAVDLYLEDGEYFPTIARFKPYVETAAHLAATKTIRRVHRHTDEEMYQWELERGSMRPMAEIETEIDEARVILVGLDGVPSWRVKEGGR